MQTLATLVRTTRPPRGLVLRNVPSEPQGSIVDWSSWYLTDEDDMGESAEQGEIIRMLLSSMDILAIEQGWAHRYWAGDQFFAWRQDQPLVRVSPDVYLIEISPPSPLPPSWQTWLPGHLPPRFAVEIVSTKWQKDYKDNPEKYWQLGCEELVIFDPDSIRLGVTKGRLPLQIYRRDEDNAFVRVYAGKGPAFSKVLGVWLVASTDGRMVRLRLAHDAAATRLVSTQGEARQAADQRARTEAEARQAADRRARTEAEARQAAEKRLQELEETLRALSGNKG